MKRASNVRVVVNDMGMPISDLYKGGVGAVVKRKEEILFSAIKDRLGDEVSSLSVLECADKLKGRLVGISKGGKDNIFLDNQLLVVFNDLEFTEDLGTPLADGRLTTKLQIVLTYQVA